MAGKRKKELSGKRNFATLMCHVWNNDVELTINQEGTCATNGESDYLHMIQHTRVHVFVF
jgi:hypothetical protein